MITSLNRIRSYGRHMVGYDVLGPNLLPTGESEVIQKAPVQDADLDAFLASAPSHAATALARMVP